MRLVGFFKRSDASRANVTVHLLAVLDVGNFLYVYLKSSSRFTIGVADVVARSLTFTANIAYSRHIDTSVGVILPWFYSISFVFRSPNDALIKTSINNISFLKRKINQKQV